MGIFCSICLSGRVLSFASKANLMLHGHSPGCILTTPSLGASSLDQRLSHNLAREKNIGKTRLFVFYLPCSTVSTKSNDTHTPLLFPTCPFFPPEDSKGISTFSPQCDCHVIHPGWITIEDFDTVKRLSAKSWICTRKASTPLYWVYGSAVQCNFFHSWKWYVWYGCHLPHLTIEHVKCGSYNWGTGFLIWFQFN